MRYLIDTHALLWMVNDYKNLSPKVKQLLLNSENTIYLSMASLWELTIKMSLKKLILDDTLENFAQEHIIGNDIQLLRIEPPHIYRLEILPLHHRDPFDRLIISQSIEDNLPILGNDRVFDKYGISRIW